MKKIIEINTEHIKKFEKSSDLYSGRQNIADAFVSDERADVTILILAYNRLEKTKECIESVLKYTRDVNFELLLIDNGSTDGTLEYFKSLEYDKTTIVHINENKSAVVAWNYISIDMISKCLVTLANDIIVTPNWLSNLMKAADSDPKIGLVNPVSSNASSEQGVDLQFTDFEDMQAKAAKFNVSDPKKWHERLRIITLGTLIKKECLYAIGLPLADMGFFHDFCDDDIAFRVRRAGYKVVLAKDTWIHHNHAVFSYEGKDPEQYAESLRIGRQNFCDKYFGVDAWKDVDNYIPEYTAVIKKTMSKRPRILGIDVRCGTPILEIKNKLREFGTFSADCYALTEDGKYVTDLQTICGAENVKAGKAQNVWDYFGGEGFDYIVLGNYINSYPEPEKLLEKLSRLLSKGGKLFYSLKNSYDVTSFLLSFGERGVAGMKHVINYTPEEFYSLSQKYGSVDFLGAAQYEKGEIPDDVVQYTKNKLKAVSVGDYKENLFRLFSDRFLFCLTK